MATAAGSGRRALLRRGTVHRRSVTLHGRRVTYREAGTGGPVVVLLHGLGGNGASWEPVMRLVGRHARVIAPDLLGHGDSAKPPDGDYSLGSFACGLRDLLMVLAVDAATVVGHSMGGGVAMQFAYQFPETTERLVLVASGGLGPDVALALRLASLPGTAMVLRLLHLVTPGWLAGTARRVAATVAPSAADLDALADALGSLADAGARGAFVHTVRGALTLSGQRISAAERLYLLSGVPVLLVAGGRDTTIPAHHTRAAHDRLPNSRLEVFAGAGHHPHVEDPRRFARVFLNFLTGTRAAATGPGELRRRMAGSPAVARTDPRSLA